MTFGYHLLAWRRKKGLSQDSLATRTGILRPYLSKLERNQADPSLSMVRRLAFALGLSVGELHDSLPAIKKLSRFAMDKLVRSSFNRENQVKYGEHALRRLRVKLGEIQFKAFLKRLMKFRESTALPLELR